MRTLLHLSAILALAAASACVGGGSGGSGGGSGTGTGTGTDSAGSGSGSDTAGSGGGNNTKNTAAISSTGDNGTKTDVKVDKPASKDDATAKQNANGAINAGKILNLLVTAAGADGNSQVLSIYIDTSKVDVPGSGIAVGKNGDAVYATYVIAGPGGNGTYSSTGKGTIDITTCPDKSGVAVVGKLNGVELGGDAVVGGPKSVTLNGAFNLVYFGGAGELTCKAPASTGGGADASGGSVNVGSLKPSGGTCNADPCDGGKNTSRNCCPYVPCMEPCLKKCFDDVSACIQGCAADPMNMQACATGCFGKVATCESACLTSCNVSATCKTAAEAYFKCTDGAQNTCASTGGDKSCVTDKCCTELKAAF